MKLLRLAPENTRFGFMRFGGGGPPQAMEGVAACRAPSRRPCTRHVRRSRRPSPLHHAAHDLPPPLHGGGQANLLRTFLT